MKKALTLALFFAVAQLWAADKVPLARKSRVKVTCEKGMRLDTKKQFVIFTGSVVLVRDDLTLRCDELAVQYMEIDGKKDISSLKGQGNVYCTETVKKIRAESDSIFYDHKTGMMVFKRESGARVQVEENELQGKVISYDRGTGELKSQGGGTRLDITLEDKK